MWIFFLTLYEQEGRLHHKVSSLPVGNYRVVFFSFPLVSLFRFSFSNSFATQQLRVVKVKAKALTNTQSSCSAAVSWVADLCGSLWHTHRDSQRAPAFHCHLFSWVLYLKETALVLVPSRPFLFLSCVCVCSKYRTAATFLYARASSFLVIFIAESGGQWHTLWMKEHSFRRCTVVAHFYSLIIPFRLTFTRR